MKFEVRYPNGTTHQVELQGTVAVIGREPTCDLVLNDVKCSRRHAVVEAGPQGMTVRDTGSANGVFLNGQKVERASIKEGDEIRLGEIYLKVLAEQVPGTLVITAEEAEEIGGPGATVPPSDSPPAPSPPQPPALPTPAPPPPPAPAPRPWKPPGPLLSRRNPPNPPPEPEVNAEPARPAATRPSPRPPPAAPSPAPPARPAGRRAPPPRPAPRVTPPAPEEVPLELSVQLQRPMVYALLAILWVALAVLSMVALVVGLAQLRGTWAIVVSILSMGLAATGAVMAYGIWTARPWAHRAQMTLAWVGIFSPVSLGAIVTLVYLLRPESRRWFDGGVYPEGADGTNDATTDLPYTFAILGGVFLSLLLTGLGVLVVRSYLKSPPVDENRAVAHLRELATAQGNFNQGTACSSYADLDGLMNPAAIIPNYRPDGPPFLRRDFPREQVNGYQFQLAVNDAVSGGESCPSRSYRRFEFTATPEDRQHRHFRVGPDRVVRVAAGRPATADDPAVDYQ